MRHKEREDKSDTIKEENQQYLESREGLIISKVLYFGDYIVLCYKNSFFVDIHKKRGDLFEQHNVKVACFSDKIEL